MISQYNMRYMIFSINLPNAILKLYLGFQPEVYRKQIGFVGF